ncbi:aldo/keto reductase [Streptomyces phaeochromogenes]|uniref:aldo/keto reductase n=1 Tax=Streptomyces phaeochromogenes TaxID=1923 RepID=UPI003867FA00|nr:aldo/keto reductase [Streptomyces phaeochromogenes]
MLDEGVVMMAGISNADVAQIHIAHEVLGGRLMSVQNQFSPAFPSSWGELEHRTKPGLAFLPRSPLGSIANAKGLAARHSAFQQAADEAGTSVYRVTPTWELAPAPVVIPITWASRSASLRGSAAAADLELAADQFALPSV